MPRLGPLGRGGEGGGSARGHVPRGRVILALVVVIVLVGLGLRSKAFLDRIPPLAHRTECRSGRGQTRTFQRYRTRASAEASFAAVLRDFLEQ